LRGTGIETLRRTARRTSDAALLLLATAARTAESTAERVAAGKQGTQVSRAGLTSATIKQYECARPKRMQRYNARYWAGKRIVLLF
jgi:hypothetical protein